MDTVLYAFEGDWTNVGISAAAMIPIAGQGFRAAQTVARLARHADEVVDVEKHGGRYGDLMAEGAHRHHMPAKQASPLKEADAPAIRMSLSDHRKTASYGGRKGSTQQAYRDKQAGLIQQGKFDEAFLMDVNDIQSKFGNKYDNAILEAMDALP